MQLSPRWVLPVLLLLLLGFVPGCKPSGPTQEEAVAFNNKIVEAQGQIMKKLLEFGAVLQDLNPNNPTALDTTRLNVLMAEMNTQIDASIATVQGLTNPDTAFALKERALDLFAFYKRAASEHYPNMIRQLAQVLDPNLTEAQAEAAMREMEAIQARLTDEEQQLDGAFQSVQQAYAQRYNIRLEDNEMQRQLDQLEQSAPAPPSDGDRPAGN